LNNLLNGVRRSEPESEDLQLGGIGKRSVEIVVGLVCVGENGADGVL
jgi:hypothetical protein